MSRDLTFYLMQRMEIADRTNRPGLDALFALDYMGAAEFEWGAISDSLKAIRSHRRIVIDHTDVSVGDTTRQVWFVGGKDDVSGAIAAFPDWLSNPRGKEPSYLPEQIAGTAKEWQRRTDAWWALNGNVMLALSEVVAHRLATGIGSRVAG